MKFLRLPCSVLLCLLMPLNPSIAQQIAQNAEVVVVPAGDKFFSWHGHPGSTYFFQASDPNDHLRSWIWSDVIESGHDEMISYEIGGTSDKAFFRLHHTDALPPSGMSLEQWDADGDTLSNSLELTLQGNPLNANSSGDGMPDGWKYAHGLPLNKNNASGLFQGGQYTNLEAYQSGVPADPNAKYHDHDNDGVDNDDDAVPNDPEINWPKTPENRYVWIEQPIGTNSHLPKWVNARGQILFEFSRQHLSLYETYPEETLDNVLWDSTSQAWIPLATSGSGNSGKVIELFGLSDQGFVFGASHMFTDFQPDSPSVNSAGMIWKPSASSPIHTCLPHISCLVL